MSLNTSNLGPVSNPDNLSAAELSALIDHTLLKSEATSEDVAKTCAEAREHGFKSVCVHGAWVPFVTRELKGSGVLVCSVAGFPLGQMSSTSKAFEAEEAVASGASEIDMVIAIGQLKAGDSDYVLADIRTVRRSIGSGGILKVIIETSQLTEEEKVLACKIAQDAGADFVKTSTGFAGGGATPEDIALMRKTVGNEMGVKASGGIRDYAAALAVLKAGASRIGASSSVAVVTGSAGTEGY